jgi:hypothetical protein
MTVCVAAQGACGFTLRRSTLPAVLSDQEFWRLSSGLSEAPGEFTHSENLVSNETRAADLIRMMRERDGVYIGVGPEQNFSYIASLRPAMAFIVDIRRENRNLHLLYKALFELSADRADFVSRLFSRPLSPGLDAAASVDDLFRMLEGTRPARTAYEATAQQVRDRLVRTRGLPLEDYDLAWIDYALEAFYLDGPEIHYSRSRPDDRRGPSYRLLMTGKDMVGRSRSYLADEEKFTFLKDLHARNLIVPVIGDFAGSGAIRRTGDYIRGHRAELAAFYASNVEVYLNRAQADAFCGNLATLPHGARTWFIGSKAIQPFGTKLKACASPG